MRALSGHLVKSLRKHKYPKQLLIINADNLRAFATCGHLNQNTVDTVRTPNLVAILPRFSHLLWLSRYSWFPPFRLNFALSLVRASFPDKALFEIAQDWPAMGCRVGTYERSSGARAPKTAATRRVSGRGAVNADVGAKPLIAFRTLPWPGFSTLFF